MCQSLGKNKLNLLQNVHLTKSVVPWQKGFFECVDRQPSQFINIVGKEDFIQPWASSGMRGCMTGPFAGSLVQSDLALSHPFSTVGCQLQIPPTHPRIGVSIAAQGWLGKDVIWPADRCTCFLQFFPLPFWTSASSQLELSIGYSQLTSYVPLPLSSLLVW
jgi:hypothetical protein